MRAARELSLPSAVYEACRLQRETGQMHTKEGVSHHGYSTTASAQHQPPRKFFDVFLYTTRARQNRACTALRRPPSGAAHARLSALRCCPVVVTTTPRRPGGWSFCPLCPRVEFYESSLAQNQIACSLPPCRASLLPRALSEEKANAQQGAGTQRRLAPATCFDRTAIWNPVIGWITRSVG